MEPESEGTEVHTHIYPRHIVLQAFQSWKPESSLTLPQLSGSLKYLIMISAQGDAVAPHFV